MTDTAATFESRVETLAPGTPVSIVEKVRAGLERPQNHDDLPDGYIASLIRTAMQAATAQPPVKSKYERIMEYGDRTWGLSKKLGAEKLRLFIEATKVIEAEDRAAAAQNTPTKAPVKQPQEGPLNPTERLRKANLESHALAKTREWVAANARAEALPPGRDRMLAQEHVSILARQCRELGVSLPT